MADTQSRNEVGDAIWLKSSEDIKITPDQCEAAIDESIRNALTLLEGGKTYDIRVTSQDYGRKIGIAWYSADDMQHFPLVARLPFPGVMDESIGCHIVARGRV